MILRTEINLKETHQSMDTGVNQFSKNDLQMSSNTFIIFSHLEIITETILNFYLIPVKMDTKKAKHNQINTHT